MTQDNSRHLSNENNDSKGSKKAPRIAPFQPLVKHIFTADPSAHVFNGRLYIYPSHDCDEYHPPDDGGEQYQMNDYHVLSLSDFDSEVIDHGVVLSVEDVPWAEKQMWAPDAAYKNGKYYLFFPAKDYDGFFRIGVAIGEKPEGPFVAEKNFIEGSFSIDPAVFIDDDGQAYMYVGGLWGGQLEKWVTGEYDPEGEGPAADEPAIGAICAKMTADMLGFETKPRPVQILDENGAPLLAKDEDRRFFEGPWMHKYKDKYYLSYSTGTTHRLVYAVSDHPMGPFTYGGRILDPVRGWTTHHSIVEFNGKWYLFYHDASMSGVDAQRCVKYAELFYNEDGSIQKVCPD
ncbi:MAG: glycoside hydrolase family 43 protein [Clostridiales bacterium]|nr:glycoside hydrolase family 43 protein [Clostridiales bacterium]